MQLFRLTDPVMVLVDPQPQGAEDCVAAVNHTIAVATVFRLVIYLQRQKAVGTGRSGLGRKVTEQFFPIVDDAICSRQGEECILCSRICPAKLQRVSVALYVELDSVGCTGKKEPLTGEI